MQNNQPSKKRGRNVLWDTRLAITALAVGGTIGFWNLFSTQMLSEPAATPQPVDPPDVGSTSQAVVINLPPMPTLVPPATEQSTLPSGSNAIQPSVNLPSQSFQPGAQILLGGSRPQARRIAPAPITRTRSSQ